MGVHIRADLTSTGSGSGGDDTDRQFTSSTTTGVGLSVKAILSQTAALFGIYDVNDVLLSGAEADGDLFAPELILRYGDPEEFRVADAIEALQANAITFGVNLFNLASQANVGQYYFSNGAPTIKAPDKFFMILGQSNAHGQGTIDGGIDVGDADLYELDSNGKFILGLDPLENQTHTTNDKMGFGVAFGREYLDNNDGETICLVLNAKSGTSFNGDDWNKGDDTYEDAVTAANKMIAMGSTFAGILWHQGESDSSVAGSPLYAANLLQFVTDLRNDIDGDNSQVPFIGGTLADDFLAGDSVGQPTANRVQVNDALVAIPNTIDYAAVASLVGLGTSDNLHFDAAALRTAGVRYYNSLVSADATSILTPLSSWSILKGYQLDGTDEYFTGPTATNLSLAGASAFTIQFIVNFDMNRTATKYMFSFFDGSATGKIEFTWVNSQFRFNVGQQYVSAAPTRSAKDYMITCVFDGSQGTDTTRAKIYVDGVDETTTANGAIPVTSPSIGSSALGVANRNTPVGSAYFDEKFIQMSVWSRALSGAEITTLYNGGSYSDPTDITNLVASWWFGDNDNDDETVVEDNVGMNNLTPVNIESGDVITL